MRNNFVSRLLTTASRRLNKNAGIGFFHKYSLSNTYNAEIFSVQHLYNARNISTKSW